MQEAFRHRLERDAVGLAVVDVQQRLVPAMAEFGPTLRNLQRLIRGFSALGRPVVATEQYPKGLGPTIPSVARLIAPPYPEKVAFSCYGCADFVARVDGWADLVLCGIEAHVCVLQTALDALARGQHVFVAADAVTSRRPESRELALRQLSEAGAVVASSETILFLLLGEAGTPVFRTVSRLVR